MMMVVVVGRKMDVDEMRNNVMENRNSMKDDRNSVRMMDNPFD